MILCPERVSQLFHSFLNLELCSGLLDFLEAWNAAFCFLIWRVIFFVSHGTFLLRLRVCCGIQADMTSINCMVVPVGSRAVNIIFMKQLIPVSFLNHLTWFSVVCILVGLGYVYCVSMHLKDSSRPLRSAFARGGIMEQSRSWVLVDTRAKSIREA